MTNRTIGLLAVILLLCIANAFTLGQWAANERQMSSWRQLAITEDTIILMQEQALKGNADTMDQCFERYIGAKPWRD